MTQPAPYRAENIALTFQELLTAIVRLRSNRQPVADAEVFRQQIREALKTAVQTARDRGGYSPEDIRMATLAVVGFLDETILTLQSPVFANWPRRPLQEELFGNHLAGETFFENLRQLLQTKKNSAWLTQTCLKFITCVFSWAIGAATASETGARSAPS